MIRFTVALKVLVLLMMMGCFIGCMDDDDDDNSSDGDAGTVVNRDSNDNSEEIRTYTIDIAFLLGKGDVEVQPAQPVYEEGQMVTITAKADSGWKFERWGGDFEAQTESVVNVRVEQNLSIEAYFVQMFSLTVETEGQGKVVVVPAKEAYDEGEQPSLEAIPDENWVFDRWTGGLAGTANPETLTMNADKTVTAVFIESP